MTIVRTLLDGSKRAVYASDVWSRWARGGDMPGSGTSAGIEVSRDKALRMGAVWSCVRLLSEDVATLPVQTFTRSGDTRSEVPKPVWMRRPNAEFTWTEVVQQLMTGLLTDGNGPWEVVRDRSTRPVEVWPRDPQTVEAERDSSGRARFRVIPRDGATSYTVEPENMLYVRGFTLPGALRGLSPISYARETIGEGIAAQQFGAKFFGQGAYAGGVIQFPGEATTAQVDEFIAMWKQHHQGVQNAHQPGVLTGGAQWQQVSIPPQDAQFIESRKFTRSEIAGMFRVPPHKIGDLERATFSNIEQQSIEYVVDSLRPWLVRLESAMNALLPTGQFVKWNVEGLLRGDTLARYQAYTQARTAGWMNVDEIRALEDLNPVPDGQGQGFVQPLNMGPLGVNPLKEGEDDA